MRLDRALAERGLARSRTQAQSWIADGRVTVNGVVAGRASQPVAQDDAVVVRDDSPRYVSRGALKLLDALDAFGAGPHADELAGGPLLVEGRRCLDAGASTGGFTQVLLERGAASVLAVDVGHGQLDPAIRDDPRVDAREGVNIRHFAPVHADEAVDLVVADLSFISLTLVVPGLVAWLADAGDGRPGGDAVLLVKPQFEVGAARLAKDGVVRDDAGRAWAVTRVVEAMLSAGLAVRGVRRSAVSGEHGNVEFFVWGRKTWQAGAVPEDLAATGMEAAAMVEREVRGGR